ncbi:MAG: YigZ family protein [Epsilonproteobacteria bacterium]|nr:YigZ family protein [Campylobacterota bacterium]
MFTIKDEFEETLEVKKSKFIAHLIPYKDFENKLQQLKQSHPKARHFVTAYRYINEYEQIIEASSDDGEPKGTSGKPSLMVLQGHDLVNVAVIVVRYFGGIKLGTGGLVRAYGDAVNLVIENADLFPYEKMETITIEFDYTDVRHVDYELNKLDIDILSKEFLSKVIYTISAPKEKMQLVHSFLDSISHIPHR